jgi:hypothetical protein
MLWLLMLALPLQALANAAQLSCTIGEYHTGQSPRLKHDVKSMKKGAGSVQETSHAACGACASGCCASAAMPGCLAAPAPWMIGSDPYFAFQPVFHAGHIPDEPERPPRQPAS